MMLFNDFLHNYKLRKATSNMKIQQIFGSIGLEYVGLYLRDGLFKSDIGFVNLNLSKGTHWVVYINENYFDSFGYAPPQELSKLIMKRNGH